MLVIRCFKMKNLFWILKGLICLEVLQNILIPHQIDALGSPCGIAANVL